MVAEKDFLVKGVNLGKKAVAGKDVTEAVLLVNQSKKEEKDSLDCFSTLVEPFVEKQRR